MKRWMGLADRSPDDGYDAQPWRPIHPILPDSTSASFEELSINGAAPDSPPEQLKLLDLKQTQVLGSDNQGIVGDKDASVAIITDLRNQIEQLQTALAKQECELKLAFENHLRDLELRQDRACEARLAELRTDIVSVLSNRTAEVLRPVLVSAILEKTVEQYRLLLSQLMASEPTSWIKIKGRDNLVDRLKDLADTSAKVTLYPQSMNEIVLETGNTVIASKLAVWASALLGEHQIE